MVRAPGIVDYDVIPRSYVVRPNTQALGGLQRLCAFATSGDPAGTGNDLFSTNAFVVRGEIPVGVGILRPQAFPVLGLGGGS